MQKLDRYVSGYFASSYGVCLLFFLGMFVLIDLLAKSDEIFENARDVAEMGYSVGALLPRYYGLMLPFVFLQVAPFVTVMAAMFAVTRLRRNNELVPMIGAGRSVFRILAPVFAYAVLLALAMGLLQQFVAPGLADQRERLKELLFDARDIRLISGTFPAGPNRFVYVSDYDIDAKKMAYFDISVLDRDEPPLMGFDARWDPNRGKFVYEESAGAGNGSRVLKELPADITPDVIESQERGPYDLSYSQAEYLYQYTGKPRWKVLLHYHLTFPLSNLLLLILGLPFVLRHESRSVLLGMVMAILICAAYFAFDAVMRNLGEKEILHPVLAAWFGVIFFGSLGVVMLDNVKT